ncbi:josephin-2 isoform X2 [Tetranychus urticae]|uniref:ubiquitinyl hydrolase 1 n=2 Tax=Tetranychus urticae TaxID=32264 RepID=T1L1I8_TETUR|nr:josephin-2 isoform X2 [Tetranychus urticae]XP_015792833.1 josephin-2 isoform X2 [Tetranychus urticae]
MSKSPLNLYHEKQRKKLCALHTLNNLLQSDAFKQADLDEICLRLSPGSRFLNPHRALLGLGNYDVNVIMSALQDKGLEAIWFDQRKDPNCLNMNHIFGFILNIDNFQKNQTLLSILNIGNLFASKKHWIAFRKIGDQYYNLDSKLDTPEAVGQETEMIQLLRDKLSSGDCQVLLVVDKKVAEDLSCYRNAE